MTNQFMLTPAAGKRLIAKALTEYAPLRQAIEKRTVVIVAGTTNGYVAEEWLKKLGQAEGFRRDRFMRGVTTPASNQGLVTGAKPFPGDVVITRRVWKKGKTIFDVADELTEGDIILKGANCINLEEDKAGIFIAHPKGGTTLTLLQPVVGRRVRLLIPAGLEKRVFDSIDGIAACLNSPGSEGLRLMPVHGEIITEIEALRILFGVEAMLIAAGGVAGAEGGIWLALEGKQEDIARARTLLEEIAGEEPFSLSS